MVRDAAQDVVLQVRQGKAKVQERFAEPIKAMINEEPWFGYRTVAAQLGFNTDTVQRIFQLRGWRVKKRPTRFRPRVQALPSVAKAPNQRWATDLCRVLAGRDGWLVLALVIDCHTRELLGWHLYRSSKAKTAEAALEHALIARYGTLGRVATAFLLRSDNGSVRPWRTSNQTLKHCSIFFDCQNSLPKHIVARISVHAKMN